MEESLCHDTYLAEELTQETFFQAMKSIDKFRGDCKFYVWLCSIAKHLWYQELKKKNRKFRDFHIKLGRRIEYGRTIPICFRV